MRQGRTEWQRRWFQGLLAWGSRQKLRQWPCSTSTMWTALSPSSPKRDIGVPPSMPHIGNFNPIFLVCQNWRHGRSGWPKRKITCLQCPSFVEQMSQANHFLRCTDVLEIRMLPHQTVSSNTKLVSHPILKFFEYFMEENSKTLIWGTMAVLGLCLTVSLR